MLTLLVTTILASGLVLLAAYVHAIARAHQDEDDHS